MKILIIGSKGFIGSNLSKYLSLKSDVVVFGADVLVDYQITDYFLIDQSNADFVDIFNKQNFDICINCSGAASVPDSVKNPQRDFYLNTLNVFNLLDSIRKYQPNCKFVNLSSAAVYGNPESLPINEKDSCRPLSPYGFHKRNAEIICEEFTTFYQIKTCNLRIFSAYGDGLKKQLFWDIAQKAKTQKSIILFGTGLESRDFIHIKDIVRAIDLVMKNGDFNNGIYNIGNGEENRIKDLANILLDALDWRGKLSFTQENRIGDPINWCADINALKLLGYQQTVKINEGLNEYAKWVKG